MHRVWLSIFLVACSSEDPPAAECAADGDCEAGRVCHALECVPPAKLACTGGSKLPRVAVRPVTVDFGFVAGEPVHAALEVESSGDCTLQLRGVAFQGPSAARFACASCADTPFPREVLPGRSLTVDLLVAPGSPGALTAMLIVSSSDLDRPELSIPLEAESVGEPNLVVTPRSVDFGYVPVSRTGEHAVQAINAAEGSAPLAIDSVTLEGSPAFSFTADPSLPLSLPSAVEDPSARLALSIRYAPQTEDAHSAMLTVTPAVGEPVIVLLNGAKDPPDVSATPASIAFGTLPLGMTGYGRVALQNTGRSPLVATRRLMIGHPDVSIPRLIPEVEPGGVYELDVVYQATLAGPMSDAIIIESNDPDLPVITVPLSGMGMASGNDIATLELRFENDADTFLDVDLRDVDLLLESPDGRICGKIDPAPDWGLFGRPRWSAQGAKENPERILLPDAMQDGRYEVSLSYLEDCSTLPTALAAELLGLGADELIDYLSEGGTSIDPGMLADAVAQTCLNRSTPDARVVVTINGVEVGERAIALSEKGDLVPALTLVRAAGVFSVE